MRCRHHKFCGQSGCFLPSEQTQLPGEQVVYAEPAPQAMAADTSAAFGAVSLLDVVVAGQQADSGATLARSAGVQQFLAQTSVAEAMRLWLGRLPQDRQQIETARRRLARDIARIDALLCDQVNVILHHPAFQALESAWRGLEYIWKTRKELLAERGLDDKAAPIELKVLNVSRKELKKNFEDAVDFDQNELFKKVYEEEFGTAGGHPYGTLIANYEFTNHPDDIDLLARLSEVGAAAFAPIITAAAPSLLGLDDFSMLEQSQELDKVFQQPRHRKWRALREKPDSQFLGLTLPRILMRRPYLDDGLRQHRFRFREDVEGPDRSRYLWGNAAWAMAGVVMRAFASSGWFADIRGVERGVEAGGIVTGLASHSFHTDADGVAQRSSTEVSVSDIHEAELCRLGFVPLSHCKDTPYSVFYSNSSVHEPGVYDDPTATANAKVSAMLQYVMCCSRIAHYLKIKARDKVGSMASVRQIENDLGAWLVDYVTPDEKASPSMKARYPLREAEVKVDEVAGEPGKFNLTIRLLPHYQLDQLATSVTLVARRMSYRE